jgi:hypothetical protein
MEYPIYLLYHPPSLSPSFPPSLPLHPPHPPFPTYHYLQPQSRQIEMAGHPGSDTPPWYSPTQHPMPQQHSGIKTCMGARGQFSLRPASK